MTSFLLVSDAGENEKRNDFSRDIMHFGKRAYGNGRLVAYGGPAVSFSSFKKRMKLVFFQFERDMMAFGKRSGGFEREMMSFGKRSPRGSEFDREMLSFGKRDEFERSMMAFGRRRK
ncbi:unnamed protein product [Haemonchus placei]|uniref:FMRFamide neuropeptide n=1 Tax=Haemonchus placei TaxID=6290 RepID=A0A0N4WG48_HAEPC|nr:unnamed protein product [Haemonchus placei]